CPLHRYCRLLEALSINDQYAAVEELNPVVRASEQFQRAETADRLLKIATGDGMATGLLYQSGSHLTIKNECPAWFFYLCDLGHMWCGIFFAASAGFTQVVVRL